MVEKARRTRVLIFGAGVIGGHVCDLLSRMDDRFDLTVSARRADALSQRVNLSITSALCLGFDPRIEAVACDVFQTDACAALIDQNNAINIWIEKLTIAWRATAAGTAVHHQNRN